MREESSRARGETSAPNLFAMALSSAGDANLDSMMSIIEESNLLSLSEWKGGASRTYGVVTKSCAVLSEDCFGFVLRK